MALSANANIALRNISLQGSGHGEGDEIAAAIDAVEAATLGVAGGYKIARGQHTTVAASDTIATGLALVVAVVATLEGDPVDGAQYVTAIVGDQAASPVAGSIIIKSWKATNSSTTTVIAATTYSKKVNWIAIGT